MGKERVALVVDDSESVRMVVACALRTIGYRVLEAASSDEAVAIMASQPISLAISDLNLEPTNGVRLLEQAAALHSEVQCVLMSGSIFPDQKVRTPFPALSKPFSPKVLIELVERLTREPVRAETLPGQTSRAAAC
jgi:DNA-binding NtrC family response regulator